MLTLYHIVPKGDGYNILGCGKAGNYFLISKETKGMNWKGELVFKSEEEAQEYITTNSLVDYKPEKFWRCENPPKNRHKPIITKLDILPILHCPDCGYTLRSMVTVGADESASGYSETLYHCTNDECMSDFEVTRFNDGKFIKMTRHFWG